MQGIEQIRHGLDQLDATLSDTAGIADDELGEGIVELTRLAVRLEGLKARALGVFETRKAYRLDGSKSAGAWLGRRANLRKETATRQVRLGRRLRHMDLTRTALETGEISVEHAEMLARLAHSARDVIRDAFVDSEDELVGFAKTLSFSEFRQAVQHWENLADPDGVEDKARDDHQARRVHCSQTLDRTFRLDGQLDVVGGTEFTTALDRIYDELFHADWKAAREIHGDQVTIDHLSRTPAQRRADALVELARRAVAAPVGAKLPEPLITVLVGYETLNGPVLELLNNGAVISPGQLAGIVTHADVERIVFQADSRKIVDLGRRSRFFTKAQRRAIQIRDRTCTFPGCDVRADHCDVDHIDPWANGGETNLSNGRCACGCHNRGRNQGHHWDTPTEPDTSDDQPDTSDDQDDDVWDDSVLDDSGQPASAQADMATRTDGQDGSSLHQTGGTDPVGSDPAASTDAVGNDEVGTAGGQDQPARSGRRPTDSPSHAGIDGAPPPPPPPATAA